jgi:4-azaleucine resistance transporter AzlC
VVLFGLSFGVLARAADFEPLAVIAFSLTTFAGSAQFAAVSVLGAGGTLGAAVGAAVLLNARYLPMGLAAAPSFEGPAWRRLLEAQLVVDEAWALSIVEEEGARRFDRRVLVGAGVLLFAAWQVGTIVGVVAGGALGEPEDLGLDAAFPALFLALLVGQLTSRQAAAAALAGGAIALALVPVAPAGVPVIAATAACLIGLRGGREAARSRGGEEQPR